MTSCVCFGPNDSYLFNSPKKWSHHNLPPAVTQLFTQEPKIRDVHELALGPNGAYAIIYKDAHGKTMLTHSGLPEDLRKWLIPVPGKGVVRDLLTLNISFSADGAYFAFDKDSTIRDNLPPAFEAAVQQRMTPQGTWHSTLDLPDCVSFGPNGAYCMVTRDGSGCWDFKGRMQDLHNFLSQSKTLQGIWPILSPYNADVHVTCFVNGHTWAAVPNHCLEQYKAFDADYKVAQQQQLQRQHQQQHQPQHHQQHHQPAAHHASSSNHSAGQTAATWLQNMNQGLKLVNNVMNIANGGSSNNNGGGGGNFNFGGDSGGDFGGDSGGNNGFWAPISNAAN